MKHLLKRCTPLDEASGTHRRERQDDPRYQVVEELLDSVSVDLRRLVHGDIDKARELAIALASSSNGACKDKAIETFGILLKKDYELGNARLAAAEVEELISYLRNEQTQEMAFIVIGDLVHEKRLPPDVLRRLASELRRATP